MQIEVELKATLRATYNLMWGQLTPGLQAMICAHEDYKIKSVQCDLVWLLDHIKIESSGLYLQGNKRVSFFVAILSLLKSRQSNTQSNKAYHEQFLELVHTVELLGGNNFFCNENLMVPTGIITLLAPKSIKSEEKEKESEEKEKEKDKQTESETDDEVNDSEVKTFFTAQDYELETERMKTIMFLMHCDEVHNIMAVS